MAKRYYISEPEDRCDGPIMITDDEHNDVAEFNHCEYATVTTTYEEALFLAEMITKNRK